VLSDCVGDQADGYLGNRGPMPGQRHQPCGRATLRRGGAAGRRLVLPPGCSQVRAWAAHPRSESGARASATMPVGQME